MPPFTSRQFKITPALRVVHLSLCSFFNPLLIFHFFIYITRFNSSRLPRLTSYLFTQQQSMSKLYASSDNWVLTHHTLDAELVADPHDAMDQLHSTTLHSLFTSFDQSATNAMTPTQSIDSLFSSRTMTTHHHHHHEQEQDAGATSSTESVSSNGSSRKVKKTTSSSISPLSLPSHVVANQSNTHRKGSSSKSSVERDAKSRRRHKKSRQIL